MVAYDLMIKTNRHLIRGGEYNDAEQLDIVRQLYENRITDGKIRKAEKVYPNFFIPPYNNGKTLPIIIPMGSKTFQVGDNAYEFEILRLLKMFSPSGDDVSHMINVTSERLKHTCFGYKSCYGCECFDASIVVLRYLTFAETDNIHWMEKQIAVYNNHFADKRHHAGIQRYYWLCLSDMPFEIAEKEIKRQKDYIISQLNQNHVMKNENDDLPLYVMRNTLARLPEFSYIKNRRPNIDEVSGCLRFDMDN